VFTAVLHPLGRFGWLGAFLFLACGALRLARYNVQAQRVGVKHFTGLPIPAAGGMIAISVLLVMDLAPEGGFEPQIVKLCFIGGVYALSFLMVSMVPYPSLKQVVIPRRKAFQALAFVVLLLVIMANYPIYFLFGFGVFYIVISPIIGPWILKRLGVLDTDEMEIFILEDEDILEDH
jgi:CDP-diacylglycerol--serine O-phosphatidyltransferase